MAASDMSTEILKGAKLDPNLEKSILQAYMKQLTDCSVNVRGNFKLQFVRKRSQMHFKNRQQNI